MNRPKLFTAALLVAGFAMASFASAQPPSCTGHSCNTSNTSNNLSNSFSPTNTNIVAPTNNNTSRAVSRGNTTRVTTGSTNLSTGADNLSSTNNFSGGRTIINAQPAYAPDLAAIAPTAPCMAAVTASAGGGGIFSIGAGFSTKDQDCEKRAYAQSLAALGKDRAALAILCQTDYVASAMAAVNEVCPGSRPVTPISHAPQVMQPGQPAYAPYSGGSGIQPRPVFGG